MKSIMMGAESLALGRSEVVVAGGFESMSNVPYYMNRYWGYKIDQTVTLLL